MLLFATIHAADSPLGRVDRTSLSDRALVELLVEHFSDWEMFLDENGAYFDITLWEDFAFDASGAVTHIALDAHFDAMVSGSIDFQYVPASAVMFNIANRRLEGSLDTSILPHPLKYLFARYNKLSGGFDCTSLPPAMSVVDISYNCFQGELDFTALPVSIHKMHLRVNNFLGTIDVSACPEGMREIDLRQNSIACVIAKVSSDIPVVRLDGNKLENGVQDVNGDKLVNPRIIA